jgi:hypothetical protein
MAWGRRCGMGCESWPDDNAYKVCPICGEKAPRYKNLEPLTPEEAAHAAFEHFYSKWDEDHDPGRLYADAPDARGKFAPRPKRLVKLSDLPPRASA